MTIEEAERIVTKTDQTDRPIQGTWNSYPN